MRRWCIPDVLGFVDKVTVKFDDRKSAEICFVNFGKAFGSSNLNTEDLVFRSRRLGNNLGFGFPDECILMLQSRKR